MIKVKDLMQKYGEYEIDEEKLKEILIKPKHKPKTVWDLELKDKYWTFEADGLIHSYLWANRKCDQDMRDYGNVFLTREEAEFEIKRRKCEAIMLKYGTRDMMSLGGTKVDKYYITYNHENDIFFIGSRVYMEANLICFSSEEFAQKAIDEIGEDRLKKYIFNVKKKVK